jgi:SNF family Na+-dependent transporter
MPAGQMFGFLWFVMLFLAAITSSLAMLQPVIALLEEGPGLKRRVSIALLSGMTTLGSGFVAYFSQRTLALDTLDFWAGTMLLLVLATVQSILYGWVLGIENGQRAMHEGAHLRVPRFVQFVLKYISPVYLLAMLLGFVVTKDQAYWRTLVTEPVIIGSLVFLLAIAAIIFSVVHIAGRRWEAEGRLATAKEHDRP